MIPIVLLPVSDSRQLELMDGLRRRTHCPGLKPNTFCGAAEACEIRALPVRTRRFAEPGNRDTFPVIRRDHRQDGRSAVCAVVLANDRVSHDRWGHCMFVTAEKPTSWARKSRVVRDLGGF